MEVFDKNFIRDEKRSLILKTAGQLFCSHGYKNVSIDDIGKKIGLTKTIIYYYFKNKAELFYLCHEQATLMLEMAFEESMQDDLIQMLESFASNYIKKLIGENSPGAVLLDVDLLLEEEREMITKRREAVYVRLQNIVAQMIDENLIKTVDPKLFVLLMVGGINVIPKWFESGGAWRADEIAETYASIYVNWLVP